MERSLQEAMHKIKISQTEMAKKQEDDRKKLESQIVALAKKDQ